MQYSCAILSFCAVLAAVGDSRAAPVHQWSRSFGGGGIGVDEGHAVAIDGAGNVALVGMAFEPDLGGGILLGGYMPIAKYTSQGEHLWSKVFSADSWAVAMDVAGNVIVSGYTDTMDPVDFGGGPLPGFSFEDMFIVKFDANGNHLWSRRCGHPDWSTYTRSVTTDALGNVIVCGAFGRTVDFGGGPVASAGVHDIFVVKYAPDGAHQWTKRLGSTGTESNAHVRVDASDNILILGTYDGTVNFGGAPIASNGWADAFVAKYTPTGTHVWSRGFGSSTHGEYVSGLAVDGSGRVVLIGHTLGVINFGGSPVTRNFVVQLSGSDGTHLWSKGFASPTISAVASDQIGNVVCTGHFGGTVDFGGGPLASVSGGGADIFAVKFDVAGNHLWSQRFGGLPTQERGLGVATDASGNFVFTGSYCGTADFGGGEFTTQGDANGFIATFGDEEPVPVLFSRFAAVPRGDFVEISWELSTDETLDSFIITRRVDGQSRPVLVASGDPRMTGTQRDRTVEPGTTYRYEMTVRTVDGNAFQSPEVDATTAMIRNDLGPNFPNPFNPSTTITYAISERMPVTIEIVDVAGAIVARLDQGVREAGSHRAAWDGRDATGRAAASGVYFYRLLGVRGVAPRKMTLLK